MLHVQNGNVKNGKNFIFLYYSKKMAGIFK